MPTVCDGANDLYIDADTPYHVCHLLKNPTEYNASLSALIEQVVAGNKLGRKMLYRIGQQTHALLNGMPAFQQLAEVSSELIGDSLRRCAMVNLCHCETSNTATPEQVLNWAQAYRDRWFCTICKLSPQPDAVICGGTFEAAAAALCVECCVAPTGMRYFVHPDLPGATWLDMCHPSARYPVDMVYSYFVETCRALGLGNRRTSPAAPNDRQAL